MTNRRIGVPLENQFKKLTARTRRAVQTGVVAGERVRPPGVRIAPSVRPISGLTGEERIMRNSVLQRLLLSARAADSALKNPANASLLGSLLTHRELQASFPKDEYSSGDLTNSSTGFRLQQRWGCAFERAVILLIADDDLLRSTLEIQPTLLQRTSPTEVVEVRPDFAILNTSVPQYFDLTTELQAPKHWKRPIYGDTVTLFTYWLPDNLEQLFSGAFMAQKDPLHPVMWNSRLRMSIGVAEQKLLRDQRDAIDFIQPDEIAPSWTAERRRAGSVTVSSKLHLQARVTSTNREAVLAAAVSYHQTYLSDVDRPLTQEQAKVAYKQGLLPSIRNISELFADSEGRNGFRNFQREVAARLDVALPRLWPRTQQGLLELSAQYSKDHFEQPHVLTRNDIIVASAAGELPSLRVFKERFADGSDHDGLFRFYRAQAERLGVVVSGVPSTCEVIVSVCAGQMTLHLGHRRVPSRVPTLWEFEQWSEKGHIPTIDVISDLFFDPSMSNIDGCQQLQMVLAKHFHMQWKPEWCTPEGLLNAAVDCMTGTEMTKSQSLSSAIYVASLKGLLPREEAFDAFFCVEGDPRYGVQIFEDLLAQRLGIEQTPRPDGAIWSL